MSGTSGKQRATDNGKALSWPSSSSSTSPLEEEEEEEHIKVSYFFMDGTASTPRRSLFLSSQGSVHQLKQIIKIQAHRNEPLSRMAVYLCRDGETLVQKLNSPDSTRFTGDVNLAIVILPDGLTYTLLDQYNNKHNLGAPPLAPHHNSTVYRQPLCLESVWWCVFLDTCTILDYLLCRRNLPDLFSPPFRAFVTQAVWNDFDRQYIRYTSDLRSDSDPFQGSVKVRNLDPLILERRLQGDHHPPVLCILCMVWFCIVFLLTVFRFVSVRPFTLQLQVGLKWDTAYRSLALLRGLFMLSTLLCTMLVVPLSPLFSHSCSRERVV